ncbi:hypothetical protein [Endozoicomonas sp. ALB032]|uniref:hypothetical protein n=1 Tax=Endozoicomonas sp. ALB032 TaxID=3403082 RepID=UPI003BB780B2
MKAGTRVLRQPLHGGEDVKFHHSETLVAWHLGTPWSSKNKVVSRRVKNNRFELNLTEAFDLDTTNSAVYNIPQSGWSAQFQRLFFE